MEGAQVGHPFFHFGRKQEEETLIVPFLTPHTSPNGQWTAELAQLAQLRCTVKTCGGNPSPVVS